MVHAAFPSMRGRSKAVSLLAIMLVVSGCSVRPEPLTHDEHIGRARQDMLTLFSKYRPIEKDLTLPDALARGLIDNLDHRLALMEQVLEQGRLNIVQYDMLPSLAAEAGYDWRDRESASTSISLLTGTPSLQPSYSSEREGIDASLRMSWNVLDFGLSYFQAKQQSDRVMIAVETRRRVINNTTRDIISAYYRALAAEKLLPRVRQGIKDTQKAIAASDRAREEQLVPAAQMLAYKRDLLQYALALRNHETILQRSREELATLINVPVDQLRLAKVKQPKLPKISTSILQLQDYALINRAELREEAYRERIDRQAVHQETLRLFPGLSAITSLNYDDNVYLFYNHWREMGLRATYNLLDVLKAYKGRQIAEAQVEYTQLRRVALSAAILAQTAISYYQYQEARSTNSTASQLSEVETQLLKAARDAEEAQSGSVLERLRQQTASISAQIEADRSYADAQTAMASLLVSVGYDFIPASVDASDPDALAADIAPALAALEQGRLPSLTSTARLLPDASAPQEGQPASQALIEAAKAQKEEEEAAPKKGFWGALFSRKPAAENVEPVLPAPLPLTKAEKSEVILDAWRRAENRPRTEAPVTTETVTDAPVRVEEKKPGFFQRIFAAPAPVQPPHEADQTTVIKTRESEAVPTAPAVAAVPAEMPVVTDNETPQQKPGLFGRLFGGAPVAAVPEHEAPVVNAVVPAPVSAEATPAVMPEVKAEALPVVEDVPVKQAEPRRMIDETALVPPSQQVDIKVEETPVVPPEKETRAPVEQKAETPASSSNLPALNVREEPAADVPPAVMPEKAEGKAVDKPAEPKAPETVPARVQVPAAVAPAPATAPQPLPATSPSAADMAAEAARRNVETPRAIEVMPAAPIVPARGAYIPSNRAQQLEAAEIEKYMNCKDAGSGCADAQPATGDKE